MDDPPPTRELVPGPSIAAVIADEEEDDDDPGAAAAAAAEEGEDPAGSGSKMTCPALRRIRLMLLTEGMELGSQTRWARS